MIIEKMTQIVSMALAVTLLITFLSALGCYAKYKISQRSVSSRDK